MIEDPFANEMAQPKITQAPEYSKAGALGGIARALAASDPDRAERIAQPITGENLKVEVLIILAEALTR